MNRQQVDGIDWVKMNVESGFGDLYMGVYGKFDLIRKIPRQGKKLDRIKWAREVELSQHHSDHETGPHVYFSSVEPGKEEIIMEKYSTDLFEYVATYLERLKADALRAGIDDEQIPEVSRNSTLKDEVIQACDGLIDKLSTMYATNQQVPFCFGDFRLENIVVKTETRPEKDTWYEHTFGLGHIVDIRQIDFDYCAAVNTCTLTKEQYEAVLKMCLTMFAHSDVFDDMFDVTGFMFGDYLRTHFKILEQALHCIYVNTDEDTKINLKKQTGLPWKTSFEAVIEELLERLDMDEIEDGGDKPMLRAMTSVTLLNHTSIRF